MAVDREVKRRQRRWAQSRGFPIDESGYLANPGHNFFRPLSVSFRLALDDAGGGELAPQRNRPPKITALHSSAALAINVFQYWQGRNGLDLPRALGFDGALELVEIEKPFNSGLRGTPPTLDVALTLSSQHLVAIESKFTEWMTRKRPKLADFEEKYLGPSSDLWANVGLPECQQLAADIAAGKETFHQLEALQLLKHALGLATSAPRPFSLLYLFYDDDSHSAIADVHRAELRRFVDLADPSLGFRAMTYQALFAALAGVDGVDSEYLDYLRVRYFP